jgi:hypothetical protein
MSAFAYVSVNVGLQTVNLIACCAADGYFIELGQMEPSDKRYGHIICPLKRVEGRGRGVRRAEYLPFLSLMRMLASVPGAGSS